MKTELITLKPNYSKIRNEFHFNIQRRVRSNVYENKKAYNRKRLGKIEY